VTARGDGERRQRTMMLGMPRATFEALAQTACTTCGRAASEARERENHPQRDRSVLCSPCIDTINAALRAAAATSHPDCEGCGVHNATRMMADVHLCLKCSKAAQRRLTATLFTGMIPVTRETVLAALAEAA
jgi:hypothetical protein